MKHTLSIFDGCKQTDRVEVDCLLDALRLGYQATMETPSRYFTLWPVWATSGIYVGTVADIHRDMHSRDLEDFLSCRETVYKQKFQEVYQHTEF